MSRILFSIIIPVYNVDKYINDCIESVLKQSFLDYEIILVDDGSTDKSKDYCDNFANQQQNISNIHKPNGGLSDARNVGLSHASGEYVIFLDSDDYWGDRDFLKKTAEIINQKNPDLITFGYKKILDGEVVTSYMPSSAGETIEQITIDGAYNICAWDKVIRRDLLTSNQIFFRKNVFSEDMEWCSLVYKHATTAAVLSESPYCYRQREGSITKTVTEKNIIDVKNNYLRCLEIKESMSACKQDAFDYFLSKNLSMFIIALTELEPNTRKAYHAFIQENISCLKKSSRKREIIIYYCIKILGISLTEHLIEEAYKRRKA